MYIIQKRGVVMDQTENKENMEAMEEEQIVVITDDEGN